MGCWCDPNYPDEIAIGCDEHARLREFLEFAKKVSTLPTSAMAMRSPFQSERMEDEKELKQIIVKTIGLLAGLTGKTVVAVAGEDLASFDYTSIFDKTRGEYISIRVDVEYEDD